MFVAPEIAKLAPRLSGWNMLQEVAQKFRDIIVEHVNNHRREQSESDSPRDFIDVYLKEIKSTTDPSSSFYKDAGRKWA